MIAAPTAIYRPRTRSVLVASGGGSMIVAEDRAPRLAASLRRVVAMLAPNGTLGIRNDTGRVALCSDQLVPLADAIDAAMVVRATAAALQSARR